MQATPVITTSLLGKSYPDGSNWRTIFNHINFTQAAGEFIAITGPSGCGKTTFLHLLAGLDKATTGTVVLCGHDLSTLPEKALSTLHSHHVGFVYQQSHLLSDFTVCENVAMPLLIQGLSRREAIDRANAHLASIDFTPYSNYYPHQLSGGMQQKVALARASVHQPQIIFADEPTGNLDPASTKLIMDYLQQLNQQHQVALCLVTHDHEIANMADQRIDLASYQ